MKKYIYFIILSLISLNIHSQALHIYHDGNSKPDVLALSGIDSVYFAPNFLDSTKCKHIFITLDGIKQYDAVDSIKFNLPHLISARHKYNVPSDWGRIKIKVSCTNNNNPIHSNYTNGIAYIGGSGVQNSYYRIEEGIYELWKKTGSDTVFFAYDGMKDTVIVNYTGIPFAKNRYDEICFAADEIEYVIDTNFPNSKLDSNINGASWHYNEEGKIVVVFSKNETSEAREFYIKPEVGDFIANSTIRQLAPFKHTAEEHMTALREFCDSTDFKSWGKKTNWWSDKPLWEWDYCVNNEFGYYYWYINDHVVNLNFDNGAYTGIHGRLPESFVVFMDDADGDLNFGISALYGKIPYNIRHHKKWPEYGWSFIQQSPWWGGGFDLEDSNLRIDSVEVEDFVNGTKSNTYDMLRKNKVTWVFNAGAVDLINGISDERVNKYLDYCDKGFGTIATVGEYWDTPYDNYRNYILLQQKLSGLPKNIVWTKGFDKADIGSYGSMSLLDSVGNLLWYRNYDYSLPDSYYINQIDSILRWHFGEPTKHEPYVSTNYTSTDYSRDGEVLVLQKASIGKGIDLVFMGDMYVDTLLTQDGVYEKDMRKAMEYFFDIEPYKTLRNRFNVYAVKVVSPNGYEGKEHRFNYNYELVFEYAQRIPNIDMDNVAITVIDYNPNFSFYVSGETNMWENGASIAWIKEGGPSSIICHETGGHGFAKLLDEYIYQGYEENHTQEGANESFREWIKATYHDKGWGMNISTTDNPDEVPWSHFLKDEHYKNEVGIYQGAWMWPKELWRASENSVMNNDFSWFNAPSREAIYKRVMQLSEGDGWVYDYETFVAFDTPIREAYVTAKSSKIKNEKKDVQQKRVDLRQPTIYKGSWRDGAKVPINIFGQDINKNIPNRNPAPPTKINKRVQNKKTRPYILYKGERISVEEF